MQNKRHFYQRQLLAIEEKLGDLDAQSNLSNNPLPGLHIVESGLNLLFCRQSMINCFAVRSFYQKQMQHDASDGDNASQIERCQYLVSRLSRYADIYQHWLESFSLDDYKSSRQELNELMGLIDQLTILAIEKTALSSLESCLASRYSDYQTRNFTFLGKTNRRSELLKEELAILREDLKETRDKLCTASLLKLCKAAQDKLYAVMQVPTDSRKYQNVSSQIMHHIFNLPCKEITCSETQIVDEALAMQHSASCQP